MSRYTLARSPTGRSLVIGTRLDDFGEGRPVSVAVDIDRQDRLEFVRKRMAVSCLVDRALQDVVPEHELDLLTGLWDGRLGLH